MDKQLLRQLYSKYQKEIYLYLFSLCKNREIAEDLTQETFLKALLSLSDSHTNMRAWLYMVARNQFFNYKKKAREFVLLESVEEVISDNGSLQIMNSLIQDERRRILYQAMQSLEADKREVLVLQYFGGVSQKEIASLLRKSPENVRVLVHRSKKELKKYMEENGYDIS